MAWFPFGKQQEILRDLSTSSPEICQETAERLLIEDGVVVITNEKSACVCRLFHLDVNGYLDRAHFLISMVSFVPEGNCHAIIV
jgi:hypothetical protein